MYNKYPIRRESLISPWGVGAIVPFPHDESLMVAGLDFWFGENHNIDDYIIADERLSKRLGGKQFVMPPDFREKKQDSEHAEMRIPAVRFPLWHYCPVCGNMEKVGSAGERRRCRGDLKPNGKETFCSKNKNTPWKLPFLVPERFVAVCPRGHIEDFPVMEWVHCKSGKPITEDCRLSRSTGGSSASLSGIRYTCTCGATATMNGAFGRGALTQIDYTCTGKRPWLGNDSDEICGEDLLVLQRGASNVWFAELASSVYIPWLPRYKNANTKDCIARGVKIFASLSASGKIDESMIREFVLRQIIDDRDIDEKQAVEEITATLANKTNGENVLTDDEYKKQEFDVLTRTVGDPDKELHVKNYTIDKYRGLDFLKSISLVHKLRETRVFMGFRRISPDYGQELAAISVKEMSWLPAIKNSGEGIMFEFDPEKLSEWASRDNVIRRVRIIEENMRNSQRLTDEKINPRYVMLHTFAHCLITALASESGYSNASIREKIYCSKYVGEDNPEMAGVLIYTASGDSEGSLGGLVRQGRPGHIEKIVARAIAEARWCAADPVCIQSAGQGQFGCNLAACHNCALLPETSCENQNMFLDRGLIIGTLDDQKLGYFGNYGEN